MICNICDQCQEPFSPVLLKIHGRFCSFECSVKFNAFCIEVNEYIETITQIKNAEQKENKNDTSS